MIEKKNDDNKMTLERAKRILTQHKYLEILCGGDGNGGNKPKCCWYFIKHGKCNHVSEYNEEFGKVICNLWHPGVEERKYLKTKCK